MNKTIKLKCDTISKTTETAADRFAPDSLETKAISIVYRVGIARKNS